MKIRNVYTCRKWMVMLSCLIFSCFPSNAQDIVENKSELQPGENIEEKIRKNFFLRADVTKTDCYVGEPLMAVFKAYSRLDANSQVLKRPSLSGFSVIEMVDAYSNEARVEKYKGENYNVHLIRKVQLFPIQPGTFTIEPAEVESVIHLRNDDGKSGFRNFFRRRREDGSLDRQLTFTTPPVQINVSALPVEGQPDDFSGAVGDYRVQIQMDDTLVVARQPAIVKLVVSGTGNFPLLTEPHISWSPEAEISGPTVDEQVDKYSFPLSGTKTFQFTIVHRDSGSYVIPPVKFSFFDPVSEKYKTAESAEVRYVVTRSAEHSAKDPEGMVFRNEKERPLHLYYFGVIVVVILGVIVFIVKKK